MTINSELLKVSGTAEEIKQEITNKGQTVVGTDSWADLPPKIDAIESGSFVYQHTLTEVVNGTIENLEDDTLSYIRPHCFRACRNLKSAKFTKIEKICSFSFYSCNSLSTLILDTPELVKLDDINAFKYTQIDTLNGTIYVPDDLWRDYQDSKQWERYKSIIKPLSLLNENAKMVTIKIYGPTDWDLKDIVFME